MDKKYLIYVLKHPITKKIRYVGVTTKSLNQRLSQHIYSKKRIGTKVSKWIKKLSISKLNPIIELIEVCDSTNWEIREKYWISHFPNLLNQHEGGKGIVINRNKTSIERSATAHMIPIIQLDKSGKFVKKWNSTKEAALYYNVGETAISNVLNYKKSIKYSCKFQWVKEEDYLTKNYPKIVEKRKIPPTAIPVFLYDYTSLNFIKEFPSQMELSRYLSQKFNKKIRASAIREALQNRSAIHNTYFVDKDRFLKFKRTDYRFVLLDIHTSTPQFFKSARDLDRKFNKYKGYFRKLISHNKLNIFENYKIYKFSEFEETNKI